MEIELAEFLRGYSERNMLQRGGLTCQILRLTGWPSATILEEFLVCQRPEFLVNFPLIDFIHSKWGVINLPSKLPHDSSMPEMGPGLLVSYGNSVTNLQVNMCDVVCSCNIDYVLIKQTITIYKIARFVMHKIKTIFFELF